MSKKRKNKGKRYKKGNTRKKASKRAVMNAWRKEANVVRAEGQLIE